MCGDGESQRTCALTVGIATTKKLYGTPTQYQQRTRLPRPSECLYCAGDVAIHFRAWDYRLQLC